MNERIRELAKEARKYAQQYVNESVIDYGKHTNEFLRIYESKFAELIVRECANINYNSPFQDGEFHAREVLAHFGVE